MPYPHVIHLRGPWEYLPLARSPNTEPSSLQSPNAALHLPPSGRVTLPGDWSGSLDTDFRGQVRYRRRFNRPTGLEGHERVWLVIDGVDACGAYSLNGHGLGHVRGYAVSAECDITNLLAASNVLEIDVSTEPIFASAAAAQMLRPGREHLGGGLIGDIRLEIRGPWFVDELSLYWEPAEPPVLRISGRVKSSRGAADAQSAARTSGTDTLALSVTACDRELLFREAAAETDFALSLAIDDWPRWPDAVDEPVLTPIEIRLFTGGTSCWQCVRETAPPQADTDEPRRTMLAAAHAPKSLTWLAYLDPGDEKWQRVLGAPRSTVGLLAILPEASYAALDRANVAVVQQMPSGWADAVCLGLAHHPSIVAWCVCTSNAEADARTYFGRRWLPSCL